MDDDDYSTIEHDFLHTKDYFNHYKFIYKERKSKLDFFHNINSTSVRDSSDLLEEAKSQLVSTKNIYKDLDAEIKNLSQEIYSAERMGEERRRKIEALKQDELSLIAEYEKMSKINEKLQINDGLNREFDQIEEKITNMYVKMENTKKLLESDSLSKKQLEKEELLKTKLVLAAKQKRLTVINTDNYIEDIYYWYEQTANLLKKVFGDVSVQTSDEKCNIKIKKGEKVLEIFLINGNYEDFILTTPDVEEETQFLKIRKHCSESSDFSAALVFFMSPQ
ncbi:hypothetical protein ENBRE01_0949 [Enteropsectra breve]|nr:hypothetical protein ENBRE01_0949 [Enteropsectra breve]